MVSKRAFRSASVAFSFAIADVTNKGYDVASNGHGVTSNDYGVTGDTYGVTSTESSWLCSLHPSPSAWSLLV
jgi:hypothetical protein